MSNNSEMNHIRIMDGKEKMIRMRISQFEAAIIMHQLGP